jgi:hypothetical protein
MAVVLLPLGPPETPRPIRTWQPMFVWSATIIVALGLVGLVGVSLAWIKTTRAAVSTYCWNPESMERAIQDLGGPTQARHRLNLYLQLPRFLTINRDVAAALLGGCGRQAIPSLCKRLEDQDERVRVFYAMGLQRFGADGAQSLPALIRMLGHASPEERKQAAYALATIGPASRPSIPSLIMLLEQFKDVC